MSKTFILLTGRARHCTPPIVGEHSEAGGKEELKE
ncbi:hypothetical protein M2092_002327 [Fusobacterium sp. PH5-44]